MSELQARICHYLNTESAFKEVEKNLNEKLQKKVKSSIQTCMPTLAPQEWDSHLFGIPLTHKFGCL